MVFTLLSWISVALVSFIFGFLALRLLHSILGKKRSVIAEVHESLVIISGIGGVMVVLSVASFFVGLISTPLRVAIFSSAILYAYYDRRLIKTYFCSRIRLVRNVFSLLSLLLFCFLVLFISYQSSIEPPHPDAGLYHLQAIMWAQHYRVVPGLGNLLPNIAFNSHWFLPIAFFDFPIQEYYSIRSINGLLLLLALWFYLGKAVQLQTNAQKWGGSMALILVLLFSVSHTWNSYYNFFHPYLLASPSTEIPVFLFTTLISTLFFQYCEERSSSPESSEHTAILISFLAAIAFTIKLSAAPLLLFTLFFLVQWTRKRRYRTTVLLIVIPLLVIAPWIARNVVMTGYLAYPLPIRTLDWFSVDWKIPFSQVRDMADIVKAWAISTSRSPQEILSGGVASWFPAWFQNFLHHPLIRWTLLPAFAFFALAEFWNVRRAREYFSLAWFPLVVMGCSIVFWFVAAPDIIRFGLGLFLTIIALLLAPAVVLLLERVSARSRGSFLLTAMLLFSLGNGLYVADLTQLKTAWKHPLPYAVPVSNGSALGPYTVSEHTYCWKNRLPCTTFRQPNLELRGKTLRDGFRLR